MVPHKYTMEEIMMVIHYMFEENFQPCQPLIAFTRGLIEKRNYGRTVYGLFKKNWLTEFYKLTGIRI